MNPRELPKFPPFFCSRSLFWQIDNLTANLCSREKTKQTEQGEIRWRKGLKLTKNFSTQKMLKSKNRFGQLELAFRKVNSQKQKGKKSVCGKKAITLTSTLTHIYRYTLSLSLSLTQPLSHTHLLSLFNSFFITKPPSHPHVLSPLSLSITMSVRKKWNNF